MRILIVVPIPLHRIHPHLQHLPNLLLVRPRMCMCLITYCILNSEGSHSTAIPEGSGIGMLSNPGKQGFEHIIK